MLLRDNRLISGNTNKSSHKNQAANFIMNSNSNASSVASNGNNNKLYFNQLNHNSNPSYLKHDNMKGSANLSSTSTFNIKNNSLSSSISESNSPTSSSSSSSSSPSTKNHIVALANSTDSNYSLEPSQKTTNEIINNIATYTKTLSDQILTKQTKIAHKSINATGSRDSNSHTASHNLDIKKQQTTYARQALNPNRLSSYDNYVISLNQELAVSKRASQNHDSLESDYQSSEYMSETLPNYIVNSGKYSRKRASIAHPSSTPSTVRKASYVASHNNSISVPPKPSNSVFARALNYAKKAATGGSATLTAANQQSVEASFTNSGTTNSSNKSWKSKLSKYLMQGSNKKLNKSSCEQDGCDIILDEDMFSSYHLSRRNPMLAKQDSTTSNSSNSNNMILLTSESFLNNLNGNAVNAQSNDVSSAFHKLTISSTGAAAATFPLITYPNEQQKQQHNSRREASENLSREDSSLRSGRSKKNNTLKHQKSVPLKPSADNGLLMLNNNATKAVVGSNGFNSLRKMFKISSSRDSVRQLFGSVKQKKSSENSPFSKTNINSSATPVPICLISNPFSTNPPSSSSSSTNDRKKSSSNISSSQTNKLVYNNTSNTLNYLCQHQQPVDYEFAIRKKNSDESLLPSPKMKKNKKSCHITNSSTDISLPKENTEMKNYNENDISSYSSSTIIKMPIKKQNKSDSVTLDRQLSKSHSTSSSKKKANLKKQKSFTSSTTTTNTLSSSMSSANSKEVNGTAVDTTASMNSHINSILFSPNHHSLNSPTNLSVHSLFLQEPDELTKFSNNKTETIKKPISIMMLNKNQKTKASKNSNGPTSVMSMLKIYKNVLNKIQKPSSSLSTSSNPLDQANQQSTEPTSRVPATQKTSLSSSCLNKLNTKALLNSQFNCVKSSDASKIRNQIDSSSSVFSYEFRNDLATEKDEKIFDNIDLNEPDCQKISRHSFKKSFIDLNESSSLHMDEAAMANKVKHYDGYKSLFKQIESQKIGPVVVSEAASAIMSIAEAVNFKCTKNSPKSICEPTVTAGNKIVESIINNTRSASVCLNVNFDDKTCPDGEDDDMLCDLEVASFFNSNKKFKTEIIHLDGNNFCYCYHEEPDKTSNNEFQQIQEPINMCFNDNELSKIIIDSGNRSDDDDNQNLDSLVKQLVAEASLSDLDGLNSMHSRHNKNFKVFKQKFESTPKTISIGKQIKPEHIINNNMNGVYRKKLDEFKIFENTSFDLEESELVDEDEEDIMSEELEKCIIDDDESDDMNNEISLINYGPNGFQNFGIPPKHVSTLENSDESLAEIDFSCNKNGNTKLASELSNGKRSASTTYSATLNSSLSSKALNDKLFEKNKPDHSSSNLDFSNIKIEKKIRLNYRKPQNANNLLNFGTLC